LFWLERARSPLLPLLRMERDKIIASVDSNDNNSNKK
jgi:hypothetical protein